MECFPHNYATSNDPQVRGREKVKVSSTFAVTVQQGLALINVCIMSVQGHLLGAVMIHQLVCAVTYRRNVVLKIHGGNCRWHREESQRTHWSVFCNYPEWIMCSLTQVGCPLIWVTIAELQKL